jgi:tetratricopeptide (TPR) repeat protein
VACNLKDCAPFASIHAADLSEARKVEWEKLYREGANSEATGEFLKALQLYARAASVDPEFAELQFRLGRCQLAVTNYDQARNSFAKARDFDALPFRADSPLNEIIKTAAARYTDQGPYLLDAADALAQISPQKICGDEWFYEHVHMNFDGNYQLALLAAEQVARLLPDSATRQSKSDWATPVLCARRLGLTDWNRYQTYEAMLVRLSDAPFTNQLNHAVRRQRYVDKLVELKGRMTPEARRQALEVYHTAVARSPDDHFLHENFAEFLEAIGDLKGAIAHWKFVRELMPHHPIAYFRLGRALGRQGEYPEAQRWLSQALLIRPDFVEALLEWSQLLLKQGKPAEAIAKCMEALRMQPENSRAHFNLANALAAQNKRAEATESLNTAIRLQPAFWEARYFLGVELAAREKIQEAQAQFTEVIRLRPDYALAHLNLGVALAKQGRMSEALFEFQETLRLDPDNKPAQQHIETIRSLINRGP